MAAAPTFSVVIPTYNRADKLIRTLLSVNRQTFKDFEVLICDDGSTDHTEKMVSRFRDNITFRSLHYLYSPNWGGPARPRNLGLQHATGEWICFLDSDDTWHPDKLQETVAHLSNSDVIYHDFHIITDNDKQKTHRARRLKQPIFKDLMVNGHNGCIINSGVTMRRSVAQRLGGCSENRLYIGIEDADLWLRASRLTDRFTHINKPLGTYFQNGGNLTAYNERMVVQLEALFNEHVSALPKPRLVILARRSHNYHIGRIYRILGQDQQALKLFKYSILSSNPDIILRSFYWIFFLTFKNLASSILRIRS